MKFNSWLTMTLVMMLCAGCTDAKNEALVDKPSDTRPNVLFIVVDDLGADDVGYQGSEILTPNIDALASQGTVINHGYAYPICSPTRAALMTGKNPLTFGIDGPMENDAMLPEEEIVMPERFQQAGYRTWMVGKWHLGMAKQAVMPHNRGFDDFYGFLGGFVDYYTHVYFGGLDWQHNGKSVKEEGHVTELLTNKAIEHLSSYQGEQPFFMYLAYSAPHTPLQYVPNPTEDYSHIADADRRVFAEMTTDVDIHIGSVLASLKDTGLADNTIVVFMSDNGGNLEAGASNGKLKGSKGSAFEGGVRVPMIVHWPGNIEAGVTDVPLFTQDWLPTLLDAADIAYSAEDFEGVSMLSSLQQGSTEVQSRAVVVGTAKSKAVYQWPWKLLSDKGKLHLYNLVDDSFETNDLLEDNPGIVASLQGYLQQDLSLPSKAAKGPPPESLFRNPDGTFNYDVRKPETRAPWAESAK